MNKNLAATCAFAAGEEGGYSADTRDTGNYHNGVLIGSNFGVTPADLARAGLPVTVPFMKALTVDVMIPIFATNYWNTLYADALPAGVDAMNVDFGYNVGSGTAARLLQKTLGFTGKDVDGSIGPMTASACDQFSAMTLQGLQKSTTFALQLSLKVVPDGIVGPLTLAALARSCNPHARALVCVLADAQIAYYQGLAQFTLYGNGWVNRTNRRLALALALIQ